MLRSMSERPRVVIVGGDPAGMTAATHLQRSDLDVEVVVVERTDRTSVSLCGIPYLLGGEVDDVEDLVVRTPTEFRETGIDVRDRTEALGVDAAAQTVRLRDLRTDVEADEHYDLLLLATGSAPVLPPLPGVRQHGQAVDSLEAGSRLLAHIESRRSIDRAVVVGSGYIGLETAEALIRRGIPATLIDRAEEVMGTLDPDMGCLVREALEDFGVEVRLGEALEAVEGDDGGCRAVRTSGGTYDAELIVMALGATPRTELAIAAGCVIGQSGAVVVDAHGRTSVPRIWAAGDLVESHHLVSGQPVNIQLATHANKQGRIAGIDMAAVLRDGSDARGAATFPGVVGTAVTKVCATEVGRTGLSEREAAAAGIDVEAVRFEGTARAGYMPDPGRVVTKVLAERGTGRIVGAQQVGSGNVAKHIDVAATWCQLGVTAEVVQTLDLAYAPPFGGTWDLLQVGARKLARALDLRVQL